MKAFACVAILLLPPFAAPAAAQNAIEEARRHYDAAAYEEALSTLATADRNSRTQIIEVEEYRALCLIALGRKTDAEHAITTIVETDPLYVPNASPRVRSFISEVRRNALPGVARRLLEQGRTAYTKKDLAGAKEQFDLLKRVLADPAMQGRPDTPDLRVLADGFVTLIAAAPPPRTEAGEPTPAPSAPKAVAPVVTPAAAVRENLPPWTPDRFSARQEFSGTLKVRIGTDGRVRAAVIEDPSHPAYDARLVQAASTWLYKPAMRNGQPVESDRLIAVKLRPSQ